MRRFALLTAIPAVLWIAASCVSNRDRPPKREGYCVHAYHYCEKCGSLQGGIYEKGPFKTYSAPDRALCIHEWREIDEPEFKRRASDQYGVDWSRDPMPFWNEDLR